MRVCSSRNLLYWSILLLEDIANLSWIVTLILSEVNRVGLKLVFFLQCHASEHSVIISISENKASDALKQLSFVIFVHLGDATTTG